MPTVNRQARTEMFVMAFKLKFISEGLPTGEMTTTTMIVGPAAAKAENCLMMKGRELLVTLV